jgi:hypothetical protein
MRLIKILMITALCILAMTRAYCQAEDFFWSDYSNITNISTSKLTGTKYIYSAQYSYSHFFHQKWYIGDIVTEDGELHTGLKLRYDAYNDQLVVHNERVNGLFIIDKYTVRSFHVQVSPGEIQYFRKISLEGTDQSGQYMQVLYNGKVDLFCQNKIIEELTTWYKDKTGRINNSVYVLRQFYYLSRDEKHLQRILPGRKQVISLFPDRKPEIKKLLRKYHFSDFSGKNLHMIIAMLDQEKLF